jgi:diphthamide biosynthesis protein 2
MEIECFVLVACPENSLVDAKARPTSLHYRHMLTYLHLKDFLRPIITPYELEIALKVEQSWSGRYILDFDVLLAEHGQVNEDGG